MVELGAGSSSTSAGSGSARTMPMLATTPPSSEEDVTAPPVYRNWTMLGYPVPVCRTWVPDLTEELGQKVYGPNSALRIEEKGRY